MSHRLKLSADALPCLYIAMKSAKLSYSRIFPETPISIWAGARIFGWTRESTPGGQYKRPRRVQHPFVHQRKIWCLLTIHFHGIDLLFATPRELDQFIHVMERNPLPSGWALVPGWAYGRPNRHWLSRLPKHTKTWKYRQAVCKYLRENKIVQEFRDFYEEQPIKFEFEGIYSYHDARVHP
jgi:hypothetical protein